MPTRNASAVWEGDLKSGAGTMRLGSGAFEGRYGFASRFGDGKGTNPEELIGAAHAGCFSMALAHGLAEAGHPPKRVETRARVELVQEEGGFRIRSITLQTEAEVPNVDEKAFLEQAESAKANCPVSVALGGTQIRLEARLKG